MSLLRQAIQKLLSGSVSQILKAIFKGREAIKNVAKLGNLCHCDTILTFQPNQLLERLLQSSLGSHDFLLYLCEIFFSFSLQAPHVIQNGFGSFIITRLSKQIITFPKQGSQAGIFGSQFHIPK